MALLLLLESLSRILMPRGGSAIGLSDYVASSLLCHVRGRIIVAGTSHNTKDWHCCRVFVSWDSRIVCVEQAFCDGQVNMKECQTKSVVDTVINDKKQARGTKCLDWQ